MKYIDKLGNLRLSRKELRIITSIVDQFSREMHWAYNRAKDKNVFEKEFIRKFGFSLNEIDYVMCELWGLRDSFEGINIEEVMISFFNEILPQKPRIIYTALNECSRNYVDYEISIIAGISKKELDEVLSEFKQKMGY